MNLALLASEFDRCAPWIEAALPYCHGNYALADVGGAGGTFANGNGTAGTTNRGGGGGGGSGSGNGGNGGSGIVIIRVRLEA